MGDTDNSVIIATVINSKKGKQGKCCVKSIVTSFHSLQNTKGSKLSADLTAKLGCDYQINIPWVK